MFHNVRADFKAFRAADKHKWRDVISENIVRSVPRWKQLGLIAVVRYVLYVYRENQLRRSCQRLGHDPRPALGWEPMGVTECARCGRILPPRVA